MNVLENLRQFSASSDEWSEMCRLHDHEFDPASPTRFEVGARIADLLESYADRIDRCGLVRAMGPGRSPAELRADAAGYRAGRDPHEQ